ncbi:MAG: AraC family transcriptional regulator [Deltaproteobacteria bacterium]|nr:AraC family transcriptional regulator [Deltaproteobacteria bacterium]
MSQLKMNRNPYASVVISEFALQVASEAGLSKSEIFEASGIDPKIFDDLDAKIPFSQYQNIFSEVVRLTGDEFFWLKPVAKENLSKNNLNWYYIFNSKNVDVLLSRTTDIYRLLTEAGTPVHMFHKDKMIIRHVESSPYIKHTNYQVDWGFSQWWGSLKLFAGPDLKLHSIRIRDTSESRIEAYEKFFQAPTSGGQFFNELIFDKKMAALKKKYGEADPNLDRIIEKVLQPALVENNNFTKLEESMYIAFQKLLIQGPPTLVKLAAKLGMSSRTLQRRLADEGLSFTDLLKKHRLNLAASYLRHPGMTVTEVAMMVGYSNPGSFSTAFQKWHGVSPSEYRLKKS